MALRVPGLRLIGMPFLAGWAYLRGVALGRNQTLAHPVLACLQVENATAAGAEPPGDIEVRKNRLGPNFAKEDKILTISSAKPHAWHRASKRDVSRLGPHPRAGSFSRAQ